MKKALWLGVVMMLLVPSASFAYGWRHRYYDRYSAPYYAEPYFYSGYPYGYYRYRPYPHYYGYRPYRYGYRYGW
ncbi:MAG TPA: hypothetical protein VGA73_10740 [Candidatus Binatia bacterium]